MTRLPEPISITLPNAETICGDLYPGSQANVLWYVHGLGGHRGGNKSEAFQAACEQRGWTFLAFDFRGHGQSDGSMHDLRGSRLLEDLTAVQTELKRRGMHRFGIVGSSMGGWASAWFSLLHGEAIPACVLLAPAFRFLTRRHESLSEEAQNQWRSTGILRVQNDWIDIELGYGIVEEIPLYPEDRLIQEWTKPLLIFHGMADDVVSYRHSLHFCDKTAGQDVQLCLFKNGDHRLLAHKDTIAEQTCRFFEKQFSEP